MRILLDTNQLVRALMRPPALATFMMAWESRRFEVVCSAEVLDEYERVLADPEISALIYPELLRAFRGHLLYDIEMVEVKDMVQICRDPDDDKVIAAAIAGSVDYLVTADEDLMDGPVTKLLRSAGIETITIGGIIRLLDQPGNWPVH